MTFTLDYGTTLGQTRALIPDITEASALFQDAQLGAFLVLEGDNPMRAAALALETLASAGGSAVTRKKVGDVEYAYSTGDLLKRAAALRERAQAVEASSTDGFDWVEWTFPGNADERRWAEALRLGA